MIDKDVKTLNNYSLTNYRKIKGFSLSMLMKMLTQKCFLSEHQQFLFSNKICTFEPSVKFLLHSIWTNDISNDGGTW